MNKGVVENKTKVNMNNENISDLMIVFGVIIFLICFFFIFQMTAVGLMGFERSIIYIGIFLFLAYIGIIFTIYPKKYKSRFLIGSGMSFSLFLIMLLFSLTLLPATKQLYEIPKEIESLFDEGYIEEDKRFEEQYNNVLFYERIIYSIMILTMLIGLILLFFYIKYHKKNLEKKKTQLPTTRY